MAKGHMPRRTQPFKSKAQWRLFFANPALRRWAKKKAHATERARGGPRTAFRSLPRRKGARKRA